MEPYVAYIVSFSAVIMITATLLSVLELNPHQTKEILMLILFFHTIIHIDIVLKKNEVRK